MDFLTNLFKPSVKRAEDAVNTAKAKEVAITEKYKLDKGAIDKEISEAEAKVQPVASDTAVKPDGVVSLFGSPATVTDETKLKAFGGKSNKKKFSNKRKRGKRTKSQKKRR
jgi:hypothetical protein